MQNKGLVKLFALIFGIVSVFQLSFTFKSNQVENNAINFANNRISEQEVDFDKKRIQEKLNFLDSLSNISVFNIGIADYTYDEVKERAINLGLDLKGGINVILQISVKDILQKYNLDYQTFIGLCQVESNDSNFDCTMFIINHDISNIVQSCAVDHLTGG